MKKSRKRLVINSLIVIAVIFGLALLAYVLTSNLHLMELIKRMHGG